MISLLLGFPFTAVKDFIFPYEPQLALRFKFFQPNSFTFFFNLKIIFFSFTDEPAICDNKQHLRGDTRHWEWSYSSDLGLETCLLSIGTTSLLNLHKSNKKINKISSSDWMVPFNGLSSLLGPIGGCSTSKTVSTALLLKVGVAKKKTEVRWEKRQWQASSKACNSVTPNPRCELANPNTLLLKRLSFLKCMCSNPSSSQGQPFQQYWWQWALSYFSTSPDVNIFKGGSRSLGNWVIK